MAGGKGRIIQQGVKVMKPKLFEDNFVNGFIKHDLITAISRKGNSVKLQWGKDHYWYEDFQTEEEAKRVYERILNKYKQGGSTMLTEVKNTIEQFIKDNRMVITWIAVLFLADHFFFNGKFRERLHGMVDNLINKTENKIKEIK